MIKELAKTIKQAILIGVIIGALIGFGNRMARNVVWVWLTKFFILIREILEMIDFIVDTDTLILLLGITLTIELAVWTFRAILYLVHFFKE